MWEIMKRCPNVHYYTNMDYGRERIEHLDVDGIDYLGIFYRDEKDPAICHLFYNITDKEEIDERAVEVKGEMNEDGVLTRDYLIL